MIWILLIYHIVAHILSELLPSKWSLLFAEYVIYTPSSLYIFKDFRLPNDEGSYFIWVLRILSVFKDFRLPNYLGIYVILL